MPLNTGELAGLAISAGGLFLTYLTYRGKGKESAQARSDRLLSERDDELEVQEKELREAREEIWRLKQTVTLLVEFLLEVIGDSRTLEWIKQRARELKGRVSP